MMYTLFFSRLRYMKPGLETDYQQRSAYLKQRAFEQCPGFVGMKTFVAEDGERVTIVRFRDEESQREWKLDPMHQVAQKKGRTDFYERYHVAVCEVVRSYDWERHPDEPALLSPESDGSAEGDR